MASVSANNQNAPNHKLILKNKTFSLPFKGLVLYIKPCVVFLPQTMSLLFISLYPTHAIFSNKCKIYYNYFSSKCKTAVVEFHLSFYNAIISVLILMLTFFFYILENNNSWICIYFPKGISRLKVESLKYEHEEMQILKYIKRD